MNAIQDRVDAINAHATRATEDILARWRAGRITDAERDHDLEIAREVANVQVRQARRGQ